VWLGTSVESPEHYSRIKQLVAVQAVIHFLSLEPLLAPVPNLPLDHVEWVIVGGESGAKFRPMKIEWAQSVFEQCRKKQIPFFGKQRAGPRTELPLLFDGKEIQEMPENLDLPKGKRGPFMPGLMHALFLA
jgi:protein gp37